jgi:peroxiredoxin
MKKLLAFTILATLIIALFSCGGKKEAQYLINGTFSGADSGWVLLKQREEGNWVTKDSTAIKEGKFTFNGKIDMPELYYIFLQNREDYFPFFIENAEINMTVYADSLEKSVVIGSESHDLYKVFQSTDEMYNKKMEDLYTQYMQARQDNDSVKAAGMESGFDAIEKEQMSNTKNFILKNGKSVVAAYLALSNAYAFDLKELQEINKAFDPSISSSNYVKKLKEREETLVKVQPGNVAPDFSMNDTTGAAFILSSLKGQYVLVDFWASWCRPCRAENPNVVAAFKEYQAKGFTILGVSLDNDRNNWIEAIKKDGLTWNHVSDLKRWANSAAKLYGVMSIPSNFLLDKEGKILAHDLRGEDLKAKLAEIFAATSAVK